MSNDPISEQVEVRRKGRQRLIGAIVLALLAVVFVPMALDPEPRRERVEPMLSIPPKEGAAPLPLVTKSPEPAAEPAKAEPAKAEPPKAEPAKAEPPKADPVKSEPPKTEPPKAAPAKEEPKAAPAKATAAPRQPEARPAAPKLEGFAVQVGAFRDDAKLAQARGKLTAAKVPHYTERLDAAAGDLTRLRAGPFPTREAAEKAAAQLKRTGLDGRVVPLP
jgi:DedD protein